MNIQRKAANAIAAKTARACDSCVRRRAHWYCAADDAFLCQGCDASVHSANQLAGRHDRVRLTAASFKPSNHPDKEKLPNYPISDVWHHGFTRKARTPRNRKDKREHTTDIFPLVPEIGNEELSFDDNEEQLLYCVPVFDPFSVELCNSSNETIMPQNVLVTDTNSIGQNGVCDLGNIGVVLPFDTEIDMESLLGTGMDEGSCGIEGLGLIECKQEDEILFDINIELKNNKLVKVEEEEELGEMIGNDLDIGFDVPRETIDWNFGYESQMDEEEYEKAAAVESEIIVEVVKHERRDHTRNFLKINHKNVIKAWDDEGRCPWINGIRPQQSTDNWPEFMGTIESGGKGSDGGREARVTRYREKRRNRLFSKKIRYEVRKLNADKRPRMKGRFVKRV